MTEVIQPIPARLKNVAVGGHVAGAADIIDDTQQKDQETINSELISAVGTGGSVDSKIAASKAEIIGDAASDYNTLGKLEDKIQAEASRAEAIEEALDGRVDTLEDAVETGGSVDSRISAAVATETTRAQAAEADRYTKSETYSKTELNNLITTPNQEYVSVIATAQTTAATDVLPATGAADTTYRVGNWDGTQYNDSVFSEYAWNGSAYIKLSTKSQVGEVYDISVNHADTKYADLAAALGTNGANIPQSLRKGGMSVKFVQSSDNKYVQYIYTGTSTANADFTNICNWQGTKAEDAVARYGVPAVNGNAVIDMYDSIVGRDINYVENRKYTNSSWVVAEGVGITTDYVPCKKGDVLVWNSGIYDSTVCLQLYNASRSRIDYFTANQESGKRSITITKDAAAYFRFSFDLSKIDEAYVLVNNTLKAVPQGAVAGIIPAIQNNIDAIDARIGREGIVLTSVDDFEYTRRHQVDTSAESSIGNRYTLGTDVIAGDKIDIQSSLSPGIVVGVFETFNKGCAGASGNILQNFSSSYTTNELSGTIKVNGVLIVKFKKSDNSAITDADIATMRASLNVTIIKKSTGVIERCDNLNEDIQSLMDIKEYNQYDMYAGVYRSSGASVTDERIRYYRKLEGKFKVAFDVPQGLKATVALFRTVAAAFSGSGIYQTVVEYQSERVDTNGYIDIPKEAPYVTITFKYAESTVYNEDAVFDLVNSSIAFTLYNKTKVEETEDGKNVFPLLYPVQYSISAYGLNEESKVRVSGHDVMAVPSGKCSIKFVDKSGHISLGVRSGYVGSSVSNNRYWFTNGYVLPFGDTDLYFIYSLGIYSGGLYSPIPLAVVERLITNGELYFEVITDDNTNIIERNTDNEKFAKSIMMNFTTYLGLNTYPTIGHTSDIHGDYVRARSFFEYCKFLGIDYCACTGDHVAYTKTNGCQYLENASENFDKTVLVTTGNHDSYQNTDGDLGLYNRNIKFFAEKFNYVANEKPYYYLDDADKKLRFIAMNLYDGNVPTNGTYYMISSAQINWLINTLASTPQDYAIFLMYHAPEINVVSINDAANFYQSSRPYWETQASDIEGSPITKIVNAFIAGTKGDSANAVISGNYTFNDAAGTEINVNYEADFTTVNTGVEFVAHLCGHEHLDSVGYYTGYDGSTQGKYKQLVLNVTCGTGVYGTSSYRYLANNSDLPRGTKGATQDSFNVYVLRRDIKSVAVARIGSHYTYDGVDRDKCVISYSD